MSSKHTNVMLVTGGSRGIGAATAILAASQGFQVVVNYLNNSEAAEAIVETIRQGGGIAMAIKADVSEESEILSLFKQTDQFGTLRSLINNAGILEQQMRLVDMDGQRLERIFQANVIGPFICCREAVRRMSTKHGGSGGTIVNVSSLASKTGSPNEYIDYAASKGAIDSLTLGLSKEVAAEGIRVNAVRPAFIHTDIHASGGEPGRIDRLIPVIPMGRGGTSEEVAEAILFFATDRSSYSTGTFIDISGGR